MGDGGGETALFEGQSFVVWVIEHGQKKPTILTLQGIENQLQCARILNVSSDAVHFIFLIFLILLLGLLIFFIFWVLVLLREMRTKSVD